MSEARPEGAQGWVRTRPNSPAEARRSMHTPRAQEGPFASSRPEGHAGQWLRPSPVPGNTRFNPHLACAWFWHVGKAPGDLSFPFSKRG